MGRPYETSVAWKRADDLVVEVYKVTQSFPKSELYGLTSQMRRAVVSVAANIAEGSARQYMKEYLRFLHIADSSLAEVAYYIHLAYRLDLIDRETKRRLETMRSQTGRPLHGLIGWVQAKIEESTVVNAPISAASVLYVTDDEHPTGGQ